MQSVYTEFLPSESQHTQKWRAWKDYF